MQTFAKQHLILNYIKVLVLITSLILSGWLVHLVFEKTETPPLPSEKNILTTTPGSSSLEIDTAQLNINIYDQHNNQKLLTFKQLFGMDKEKNQLLEIQTFLKDPQKAKDYGIDPPAGALLYGVPGTGKTALIEALSKEANLPLLKVNGADFTSKYKGDSTTKVHKLFAKARELAPCIVFVDECETALNDLESVESDAELNNTVNAFKEELTSLSNDANKPIFFVGATNYIDRIDEAIKSRLGLLIEVETLKLPARQQFLTFLTQKRFKKISANGSKYLTLLAHILEAEPKLQPQRQIIKILEKGAMAAFKDNSPLIEATHLHQGLLNFITLPRFEAIAKTLDPQVINPQ